MNLLHSYSYGLLASWALQFVGLTGLAWKLPLRLWPLRCLCAVSALADVVEALMHNGTNSYAMVYWLFRIVELNFMVYSACHIAGLVIPLWRFRIWSMFAVGLAATLSNGVPHSNDQMNIYQTFMLLLAGGVSLFFAMAAGGLRSCIVSMALALMCSLQLICTLIWRYIGYNNEMWFVASLSGLGALAWSVREEHRG